MERQGMAPWIFSIRRPRNEPAQDFPPGLAERVRYLPEDAGLADEVRWLRRCDRLPEASRPDELRLKGLRDKTRVAEAAWLGTQCRTLGIGHVHTHFAGLAARAAYWLRTHFGVGYSLTAHANDVFCPPEDGLSVTLEELMRAARFVVTVSDFSAAQLRARFPFAAGKIHRVYNGIDTRGFARARPAVVAAGAGSAPLIVSVGRYIEKKGFSDLIAACARLRDRGVVFQCRIVGEGPLGGELAAEIEGSGLGGVVELTGPRSAGEVAALLAAARVFALPCVEEADGGMDNLPTVIAEAMAAGLPVVSTRLAGVPEMVLDGVTGLLVAPREPEALAGALARLLGEPVAAAAMGRAGRARARGMFEARETTRRLKRLLLAEVPGIGIGREVWRRDPGLWWWAWGKRKGKEIGDRR